MKKVNKDPFSNGTEYMMFEDACCSKCVKASMPKGDYTYTNCDENNMPNHCSIQRDIFTRMYSYEPISEHTIQICYDFSMKGILCPYMKTERKKYTKKVKNQLNLDL